MLEYSQEMIYRKRKSNSNFLTQNGGFTLVETLVGSVVFALVALSAYQAFSGLMGAVMASRAKIAATSVANEQFEIIRNLAYEDVGIINGLPSGRLQREKIVTRDNYSFNVQTTIRNVDDPFDGTIGGTPSDTSPSDYRAAYLDITCSNCKFFAPLKFTTLVAPYALETASTNGALFIQVFDALGTPVQGASVHIVNTQTNPDTIIDDTTDNGGWIKIIDAPPGVNAYSITATKTGYTTDQTYPLNGTAGPDPLNPDATVVVQQVTQTSLSIDQVSSLVVSSVDASCVALPNIGFSLVGEKLIGLPDYLKYIAHNFTTDASGNTTIPNVEWDTYDTELTSPGTYDLAGMSVLPTFTVSPNEVKNINIIAVPHASNALLVSVEDPSGVAIDGATVQLQKGIFDETKTTSLLGTCPTPGQVFWNSLEGGTYTLTVSKAGYQTTIVNFPASSWQHQRIILNP